MVNTENKAITWEESRKITEQLNTNLMSIDDNTLQLITSQPGIVAWYYGGDELGFGLAKDPTPKMIYVGRGGADVIRHFVDGRTAESTIRRSLVALLHNKYDLKPIASSDDASDANRFFNYAVDEASDERLTMWIKSNIQIAFVPVKEEEMLDTKQGLINYNAPLLNLQNNPDNKYGAEIKMWRKKCSDMAASQVE